METMNIDEKTRNDKRTSGKSGGTNYSDQKKKHYNNRKDNDDDAMDIDRLSPEKRTILMKKGACFICEKPGHLARDHDEHEKKEKGKWRASTRRTEASTDTSAKKKDVDKILALIQSLSEKETKQIVDKLSITEEKKEENGDEESDSDF
jgi:hypothetical protein